MVSSWIGRGYSAGAEAGEGGAVDQTDVFRQGATATSLPAWLETVDAVEFDVRGAGTDPMTGQPDLPKRLGWELRLVYADEIGL